LVACTANCLPGCSQGGEANPSAEPFVAASPRVFEQGRKIYGYSCAACHQLHGKGMEGVGPPIVGSPWITGPEGRLIRIVLHGVRGPITVKKADYNLEMPAMGFFTDQELAAVLSYTRQAWGHRASAVDAQTVRRIREAESKRGDSWTAEELMALPAD